MEDEEIWWRMPEVTAYSGVPRETLRYWRRNKRGPRSSMIAGHVVYKKSDVVAWMNDQFEKAAR